MLMKKVTSVVVVLLICCSYLNSQVISTEVINKYSPNVIAKLYDIAKEIPLNEEQQESIAKQILASDILLVQAIRQAKSTAEIDKLQQNENIKIMVILGRYAVEYAKKKAEDFAKTAANGETDFLLSSYHVDTNFSKTIFSSQFNKYKTLYTQFLLYNFTESKASEQISKSMQKYDSASFDLYRVIYSAKFLDYYLKEAKKLKPNIPTEVVDRISNSFYESVRRNQFNDWAQLMLDVMQHIYPDTSLIAHFYKKEIGRQASFLAAAEKYNLINIQHVSNDGYNLIYPLVKEKNYRQVLLGYTYGGNIKLRDSLITKVSKFFDSLIIATLLRDGSLLNYNQFAIALKYKNVLKLPESLIDTLLWHAMELRNRQDSILLKEPYAKMDFKAYEAKYMNELLTEDQYTQLLIIKNKSQAQIDADNDWDDIEKCGLDKSLDKEKVKKELFLYYLSKWDVYYRFADDRLKQEANLRFTKDNQPGVLNMLSAARKQQKPVNENTGIKVKW